MRKQQSHWPALTYHHPCFDFSESVRANADEKYVFIHGYYKVLSSDNAKLI